MRLSFDGRVFAVTGAAQGIGAAIVATLAEAGAIARYCADTAGLPVAQPVNAR